MYVSDATSTAAVGTLSPETERGHDSQAHCLLHHGAAARHCWANVLDGPAPQREETPAADQDGLMPATEEQGGKRQVF